MLSSLFSAIILCTIRAKEYTNHITTSTDGSFNFILNRGDTIFSTSRNAKLAMQGSDGHLVFYSNLHDSHVVQWATGVLNGEYVELDSSGNLMVKDNRDRIIWQSNTGGHATTQPHHLIIDEACAYVMDNTNAVLWHQGNGCVAPYPTLSPPPTDAPTTSNPTSKPTDVPTTDNPTHTPTVLPSSTPTAAPTHSPTLLQGIIINNECVAFSSIEAVQDGSAQSHQVGWIKVASCTEYPECAFTYYHDDAALASQAISVKFQPPGGAIHSDYTDRVITAKVNSNPVEALNDYTEMSYQYSRATGNLTGLSDPTNWITLATDTLWNGKYSPQAPHPFDSRMFHAVGNRNGLHVIPNKNNASTRTSCEWKYQQTLGIDIEILFGFAAQTCLPPTPAPTEMPSSDPTSSPSSNPTHIPTAVPTMIPSKQPTTIPSKQPSRDPSASPVTHPPNGVTITANVPHVSSTYLYDSVAPYSKEEERVGNQDQVNVNYSEVLNYVIVAMGVIICCMVGVCLYLAFRYQTRKGLVEAQIALSEARIANVEINGNNAPKQSDANPNAAAPAANAMQNNDHNMHAMYGGMAASDPMWR